MNCAKKNVLNTNFYSNNSKMKMSYAVRYSKRWNKTTWCKFFHATIYFYSTWLNNFNRCWLWQSREIICKFFEITTSSWIYNGMSIIVITILKTASWIEVNDIIGVDLSLSTFNHIFLGENLILNWTIWCMKFAVSSIENI